MTEPPPWMKPVAKAPAPARRRIRGKASSNANTDSHEMVQAGQNGIPIEQPVHGDTPCQIVQADGKSTLSRGRIPGSRKAEGKEQVFASGPYARLWNCYYKCIELLLTNEILKNASCQKKTNRSQMASLSVGKRLSSSVRKSVHGLSSGSWNRKSKRSWRSEMFVVVDDV